jgi:DNA helicase-4
MINNFDEIISIQNPDWERFEEIEPYIEGDYGGVFWHLIPDRVWWILFAPTNKKPEVVSNHREKIINEYESIIGVSNKVQDRLRSEDAQTDSDDCDNSGDEMQRWGDQIRSPVFAEPHYEYDELEEYLSDINDGLSRKRKILDRCKCLLSSPESAFLRKGEYDELSGARNILAMSVEESKKLKEEIEQVKQNALTIVNRKIPEWERRITKLEANSQPYISLEEYLADGELIDKIKSLHDELVAAIQETPIHLISEPGIERLQELEEQADTLLEELEQSKQRYACEHSHRLKELAVTVLDEFQDWTVSAGEDKVSTLHPEERNVRIDELRREITEFLTAPYSFHVEEDCMGELRQYESHLAEYEESVSETIAELQEELRSIEGRAESYIALEEYLSADNLIEEADSLYRELEDTREQVPLHIFSDSSGECLRDLAYRADTLVEKLKKSRRQFAAKRFSRLQELAVTVIHALQKHVNLSNEVEQPTISYNKLDMRVGALQAKITEYFSAPYRAFASETEIERLLGYQLQLAKCERSFAETITDRRKQLDSLQEQAAPYLELEQYLSEDELLEVIISVADEIEDTVDTISIQFLPCSLEKQFRDLETRSSTLAQELEQSRRRYAIARFEKLKESVEETLSEIEEQLEPARSQGEEITSPQSIQKTIKTVRDAVDAELAAPWKRHFQNDQYGTLGQFKSQLSSHEEFIDEKVYFDKHMRGYSEWSNQLHTTAAPYFDYEIYLTEPARDELISSINTFISDIDAFAEKRNLTLLADADRERFQLLRDSALAIEPHLEEYNPEFVQRQRAKCASLFTDIGPENHDLTGEQQQAVIRNGIYNQVIAAAGTGKTLTLTTRIVYLISVQNINPNEILVVTYTGKAKDEMQRRLAEQFDITNVEVRTVNSFGHKLIQNARDNIIDVIDEHEQLNFIERQIREERNSSESEFLDHYYEFLVHFDDVYYEEADFENKKQYVQARAEEDYITLRGTEVRSRAEKLIADFLYIHRIDYRYEDRATWADTANNKTGYCPDFYLPAYDMYIEHWGVDESGSVAPWFSYTSEEYRQKMLWARQQFAETEYGLIDTYEFEHGANRLKDALRHRLTHHGVELDQMNFDVLVETAFDYEHREDWIKKQFISFIQNAKRFEVMPDEIKLNLSDQNPRQYHFGHCGIHLLQKYALHLTEHGLIDFTDQIRDAVELVRENPDRYQSRYEHVLVDEFQDIGAGKLELIQEFTGPNAAKFFAVGDDWQSIYSFQGASIHHFTQFEMHFGNPVRTDLTVNYRSPQSIISAGNQLIKHNTEQLEKTVHTASDSDVAPHVHTLRGYDDRFYDYVRRVRRYTTDLARKYVSAGADLSEIMILCRFDGAVSYLDEIKKGLKSQEIPYVGKDESDRYQGPDNKTEDGISVFSVHQAKGREAKHVILVHAAEGSYGFPPNDRDNELLAPVQPLGASGIEEERRAFYVAITRAKRSLDLLTRADHESRFLDEIADHTKIVDTGQVEPLGEVGERMSVIVKVTELKNPWRKQHQRGIIADMYGGSARFVSWTSDTPPTLEQGEWYSISNVLVDEYKNEKELVISDEDSVIHRPDRPQDPEPIELLE